MSRAYDNAADGRYQQGGRRNLIINGAMQVAQRGTSFTGLGSGGAINYTLDRMRVASAGTGIHTVTQSTDAPDGFANSFKMECTTASAPTSSGYLQFTQALEGQDLQRFKKGTSNPENMTVSFWVKGSKTGTHIFDMYDNDNTRQISKAYTINTANTWEYKTITLDGDTTGAFDNDNSTSVYCIWWLAAGTDFSSGTLNTSWGSAATNINRAVGSPNYGDTVGNTFQITGVQLEVGTIATPFEHRSYGEELALCQRYYQRWGGDDIYVPFATGLTSTTSRGDFQIHAKSPMRSKPTFAYNSVLVSDIQSYSIPVSSVTSPTNQSSVDGNYVYFALSTSGATAYRPAVLLANNSTSGYISLDAEL